MDHYKLLWEKSRVQIGIHMAQFADCNDQEKVLLLPVMV